MQSFRERCGFHGNQQSYQPTSQDASRLENYRHQSQAGPNCERQRLVAKEYYSQQQLPYPGYENSAVEKYHRGNKQLAGQQLQGRPAFSNYAVQENSPYPARYSGDESLQGWGSQAQALPGGVAKYEDSLMKKTAAAAALAGGRPYHEPATTPLPFRTHFQQQQQQQQQAPQQQPPALPYPKLQRQKLPNDVSSPMPFSQSPHFGQHSQSFPASSTYSSPPAHSYKSCTAPSGQPPPTDGTSPDALSGNCKNLQKEKLPENLLSDLSLQSLTALTSQVENISNTVQQLLLSKATVPQKKGIKTPSRTPEQLKGQHCSPESSTYSAEQVGTPLSDPLSTPQSVHAETQDTDYLSGSEDQLERSFLFCNQNRSPARVNSNSKAKPESVSTCSVTSPDDMSTKSDDSFQSIHASLPLETFTKYVTNERDCPRLLLSALSQEELASEIIVLQDAISEKADKAWANSPMLSKEATKSPFQMENHHPCLDSMVKGAWPSQGDSSTLTEPLKLDKASGASTGKDFGEEVYEGPQVEFAATETKDALKDATPLAFNSKSSIPAATSSAGAAGYSCYSNTTANSVGSENTMEHFEWPEESLGEACLRWKELQATDLPKGLFPSKLGGSCKEKKNACDLDLCDGEQPAKSEPAQDFSQQAMEEEEEETLTYDEATKADSERWLQDTRHCCSAGDFSEIPIISSPELKESDLEAEEYSSLCELPGSEQKSVTYDASSPKPTEMPPVLSSSEVPMSAEETVSTVEKESSAPTPRLSGQSIILLGPAVGTETKVKSWFKSSLPHIQAEDESGEGETSHPEVANAESAPLVMVKQPLAPESMLGKAEPVSRGKSLRNKRVHCRLPEEDGPGSAVPSPFSDLPAAGGMASACLRPDSQVEMPSKNAQSQTPRFPSEGLPARMCTRSFTALAEPRAPALLEGLKAPSHQEKLGKKPGCGVKQRVAFKARKRSGRSAPKVVQNAGDATLLVPGLVTVEEAAGPTPPEGDMVEAGERDQRSMILRSRTKTQEVFYTKRRRGKRAADVRLKNCKVPKKLISNNHLPPAFKLAAPGSPHKEGKKITSPNLKKFACKPVATAAAATMATYGTTLGPAGAERERAVKHSGVAPGDMRLHKPVAAQKMPATPMAEQLCRNPNGRAPKGKLSGGKKVSAEGCQGEACASALGVQPGSTITAKSLGLLPKKRNRKGKAAALGMAKAPMGSTPLPTLPRERVAGAGGGGEEAAWEGKKPKSEEKEAGSGESPPEGRPTAGPARGPKPRANHSNYNGYSKRQRKRLAHGKAKAVPARCKSRGKRRRQQSQQAPLLQPAEPEIRLKYISCKRLRADSRAPHFAPYIHVERRGEFTTTCTVINSPLEEARLQRGPSGPAPPPQAALPASSTMHMGPVVSKALSAACLVCCLCRNPANYKDLGDLCGPYYPEDCLPKKKSRLKEKVRTEGPGEDAAPPVAASERAARGTEGGCSAGSKMARPEGSGEAAKQSSLRSSPRGMFRRLQSCYCCDERTEGEEVAEKPRRHECHKAESLPQEPAGDTQEHWLHEACAVWTAGVFLVAGKLYGLQEAVKAAADLKCSSCQQAGATVSCCQKGCPHTYHYTCAIDTGCLLTEESFSLKCPKHKVRP
ncbi:Retinoic acid-induced protein 1, partial [Calypte anna]